KKAAAIKKTSTIHFSDDESAEEETAQNYNSNVLTTQTNFFDDDWYELGMEEKEDESDNDDEQTDTSTDYWTDEQDELSIKLPFSVEYAYADASQNEMFGNTEEKTL
ncbi:unnamed protein product, partial [Didymodactylos carnosus]